MSRLNTAAAVAMALLPVATTDGEPLTPVRTISVSSNRVDLAALTPDGQQLAFCESQDIHLYDVKDGMPIGTLQGHTENVCSLRFSPDGEFIASGDTGKKIRLWRVGSEASIRVLKGHTAPVTDVAFTPDGTSLISSSSHLTSNLNELRWWNTDTGNWDYMIRTVRPRCPVCLAISSDGKLLAVGEHSGGVALYERTGFGARERFTPEQSTGIPQGVFMSHNEQPVTSVMFSTDNRVLMSSGLDNTIRCWDTETGREQLRIEGLDDEGGLVGAALLAGDSRVASITRKGRIQVHSATDGRLLGQVRGTRQQVRGLTMSQDRRTLATYGTRGAVDVWTVSSTNEN